MRARHPREGEGLARGRLQGRHATPRGSLLNHWFHTDHRLPNGRKFAYHYFQREAVETLIYLYEVAKVRRHKSLVETYATRSDLRLLQYDDFARYCVKMATGSGKTKVMSLAVAWHTSTPWPRRATTSPRRSCSSPRT